MDADSEQPVDAETLARLAELERLAVRLDSQFRIPGTQIRFGFDPIVGLVPLIGDLCMAAIGLPIILEARRAGLRTPLLVRMIGNTSLDVLIGIVPLAGPVVDVFFRANERNLRLLLEAVADRRSRLDDVASP